MGKSRIAPYRFSLNQVYFDKFFFFLNYINFCKLLSRITLCQLLVTIALQFVSSSYESIGINLVLSVVFVMALFFRQENLKFWSINGQGKIWGLVLSAAGAFVLVLWEGPVLLTSRLSNIQATSDGVIGLIMIVVGVLATSFWNITVVRKFLQTKVYQ